MTRPWTVISEREIAGALLILAVVPFPVGLGAPNE